MGKHFTKLYYPEIAWCIQDLQLEYVPICWRFCKIRPYGYVYKRATHYLIKIARNIDTEEKIKTIFHELRHVWQWESELLDPSGKIWYSRKRAYHLWKFEYDKRPDEIDAFKYEESAYRRYKREL